jgi:hypothetical protein
LGNSKEAKLEDAKLEAARRAEKAVRGSHVRAVSKKALWNWFLSSLLSSNSKKYSLPEWMEWKEESAKLWFASENQQLQYSVDDVNSIEEVFITECTLGTTVSHAFNTEINKIRNHISNHQKVFEIDWEATMNMGTKRVDEAGNPVGSSDIANTAPEKPGNPPSLNDYHSRSDYIRAKAKWDIACRQYAAWMEKYGKKDTPNEPTQGESE